MVRRLLSNFARIRTRYCLRRAARTAASAVDTRNRCYVVAGMTRILFPYLKPAAFYYFVPAADVVDNHTHCYTASRRTRSRSPREGSAAAFCRFAPDGRSVDARPRT